MPKHAIRIVALVCVLTVVELGAIRASGSGAVIAQDATPAPVLGDLPDGVSYEPIDRGTLDEVLAISRVIGVSRVTLPPEAAQATYTVLPTVYAVEEGTVTLDVDPELPTGARLVRRTGDDGYDYSLVVLPGTSLELEAGDALGVPGTPDSEAPYASISAANRSEDPVSYIDIEIFPTGNPHVLATSGDPVVQGLDISLGLATAQEPTPDWIAVGRLTLQPGASIALLGRAPMLVLVQDGTLSLSVDEGDAAVQRFGVRWGDEPESLFSGDSSDLTANDAAFLLPGTIGAMSNPSPDPLTALLVIVLAPGVL